MDLLRRVQTISLLLASLAVACSEPEFAPPDGDVTDPGGGGTGGPGAPGFVLPDGGTALPTPAPPGQIPGGGPQCAGQAFKAETSPLDLMLLIDTSDSMNQLSGTRSKWQLAQLALASFLGDGQSSGLGVGLQFFPHLAPRACRAPSDCEVPFSGRTNYCAFRNVCAGGNATFPLQPCGATVGCPIGQNCVPAGSCSTGGADCVNLGQPCPGAQGTCQSGVGVCSRVLPSVECEATNYSTPALQIGVLPTAQPSLVNVLGYKVPGNTADGVGTPMGPAIRGIIAHLQAHLAANRGRKAALVVATDGFPSGCTTPADSQLGIAQSLAAANSGPTPIPTYVIGVFGAQEITAGQNFLNQLAMAGGSGKAFVLNATDDLAQQLQGALNQIRGAALPCEYQVPAAAGGGRIDYGKVNVRFTGTGGGENVLYVESPDRCDAARGGWYYDYVPGKGPTSRLLMCDATCRRFKTDQTGKVDIVYGCATQVIN
jgi:hypothetical protein